MKRLRTAALLVCLLLGERRTFSQGPPLSPLYGKKIVAVYFEPAEQPLTRDQLGLSFDVRPGDTLKEFELGRAIQRLWGTGRYSNIVIDGSESDGGLVLTVHTSPAFFVGEVSVEGVPEPPTEGQLVNTSGLNLGDRFEESQLAAATASITELLRRNGFYTPKITHQTEYFTKTESARISFYVEPGPRARLIAPEFTGDPQKSYKKLVRITDWRRWYGLGSYKEVKQNIVQQGVDHLRDAYRKSDHMEATVQLTKAEYDPAAATVHPIITINAGPTVVVQTDGAKVPKGDLRNLLPIYQERAVDRELLMEGQQNLERKFQLEGYFDAAVSYSIAPRSESGQQVIRYTIDKGRRYRLVYLDLLGNRYFDAQTVRERMNVTPARFPRYPRGRFSQPMLAQDVETIADLYRANGFKDVAVNARVEHDWKGKHQDLAVLVEIKEGPQWLVNSLELKGVDLKLLDTISALLASTQGQPFSYANLAADRDAVLNWYYNNGYPDASFEASSSPARQPNRVNLVYTIREGRRVFVRDVLITGLVATRPDLVMKRLAVEAGQPLSQSGIVETQRALYDLGIFSEVDVAIQNPEGKESSKYVLIDVEEAKKYSLSMGVGAEAGYLGGSATNFNSPAGTAAFSPRISMGLTRSNMFGLAQTAGVNGRVSLYDQRVILNYIVPQFKGSRDSNLTFSTLLDRSLDINTYLSVRSESAIQLGQRLSKTIQVQYRATARFVFIDQSTLKISPDLIPIYSQPVKTISVSASVIQDRRDDPVETHRGFYNTLDVGYAIPFAASSTDYTRLIARNSTYTPISRDVVFARNTFFGWLYNLSSNPVPLPENFYGGGATTHRGFPANQAGPRDLTTGFPIGGQAFLFLQNELRFPLVGKSIGGVIFWDLGNVYSNASSLSFRYHQNNDQDFNYMVQAFGLGIRVKTPVGPMRADFAFGPNTPRFVGFVGTQDELINGGGQYNVPQRVNRFQFHFSIGEAF